MIKENTTCPFCESNLPMQVLTRDREMEFDGIPATVRGLLYSVCGSCGTEVVLPQQTRVNKRTIIDAHKDSLGLMTGSDILKLRNKLGLTQQEASQLFGGGANAFSKYENGLVTQTKAMDNLLRLASAIPEAADFLARRQNVTLRRLVMPVIPFAIVGTSLAMRHELATSKLEFDAYSIGNTYALSHPTEVGQLKITVIGDKPELIYQVGPDASSNNFKYFDLSAAVH